MSDNQPISTVHVCEQSTPQAPIEWETVALTIDLAIDIIHDAGGPIDGDHGTWKDGAIWAAHFFARKLLNIDLENPHE